MNWLEIFQELEEFGIGAAIRESLWLFPVIEAGHLLALALLGGAVLVVDLRLIGFSVTDRQPREVLSQVSPWFLLALGLMLATGIPLFLSEAVKCYFNFSFWVKMIGLAIGIVFTFGIRNRLVMRFELSHWVLKGLGLVSIGIWFTVAGAGRWIGFSG